MPSLRSSSAPRRSSRTSEIDLKKKKQQQQQQQQQVKKAKSTATQSARASKPKPKAPEPKKKETKSTASAPEKQKKKKVEQKSDPAAAARSKPAAPTRGPPKQRDAPPTAEEKKELKAAKKESAANAKQAAGSAAPSNTNKDDDSKKDAKPRAAAKQTSGPYKEGQTVEDITLKNDSDQEVSLSSLYNESGLVIFTYPKANTPGCTTQSCNYRDITSEFESLGYKVLGLSRDSPKSQSSWKTKHSFKYDLLCDPEAKLLKKLGATDTQKRCHFVIEKGGKFLEAKIGVKPADDAKNALEFVKSLDGKKKD
ncbi:thioredoxin peroxidase DOT5 [Sporobolomyces koalae]|uniref:thioredoxin peroxidase DOT5 n=1 Tax=Sporobolomyces koalae TaxID=500713 RepID=UPI00316C74D4